MWQKLKSFLANDSAFYTVLLLLVAVGSFGLGRQSVQEREGIAAPAVGVEALAPAAVAQSVAKTATTSAPLAAAAPLAEPKTAAVVGSKSGKKYHLPDCPGAKRIKPENLLSFETIDAAKAAGYTPAANCPGLK